MSWFERSCTAAGADAVTVCPRSSNGRKPAGWDPRPGASGCIPGRCVRRLLLLQYVRGRTWKDECRRQLFGWAECVRLRGHGRERVGVDGQPWSAETTPVWCGAARGTTTMTTPPARSQLHQPAVPCQLPRVSLRQDLSFTLFLLFCYALSSKPPQARERRDGAGRSPAGIFYPTIFG